MAMKDIHTRLSEYIEFAEATGKFHDAAFYSDCQKELSILNQTIKQQEDVISVLNRDIALHKGISDFDDHGISRSERIRLLKKRKKEGQEKRKLNRKQSLWLLKELKVKHEVKNYGGHIIVTGKDFIFDFMPSTGGFVGRDGGPEGRGVFGLLKHCNVDEKLLKNYINLNNRRNSYE